MVTGCATAVYYVCASWIRTFAKLKPRENFVLRFLEPCNPRNIVPTKISTYMVYIPMYLPLVTYHAHPTPSHPHTLTTHVSSFFIPHSNTMAIYTYLSLTHILPHSTNMPYIYTALHLSNRSSLFLPLVTYLHAHPRDHHTCFIIPDTYLQYRGYIYIIISRISN